MPDEEDRDDGRGAVLQLEVDFEPFGWWCERPNPLSTVIETHFTRDPDSAKYYSRPGWTVTALYAAPVSPAPSDVVEALREIDRWITDYWRVGKDAPTNLLAQIRARILAALSGKGAAPSGDACAHEGWSFAKNGRCCPKCNVFVVDFGD